MEKHTPPYLLLELDSNLSIDDDVQLLNEISENGAKAFRSLFVALPFDRMKQLSSQFPDSGIVFGASSMNRADSGQFTESIAGKMIKNNGGTFTLIGSRNERKRLGSDVQRALKAKLERALEAGLKPIYLVDLEAELTPQLEMLAEVPGYFKGPHPLLVVQPAFTTFAHYLPSPSEIQSIYDAFKEPLVSILPDHYKHLSLIVELPADLAGFSDLLAGTPFDGHFCIKSGLYPHALHQEVVSLAKVQASENPL
jgi:hypothetical protein